MSGTGHQVDLALARIRHWRRMRAEQLQYRDIAARADELKRSATPAATLTILLAELISQRSNRVTRATRLLDAWSALLPQRIVNEEVGDYVEDVRRRSAEGQKLLVWLRCAMCIFWTGFNTLGYLVRGVKRVK